MQSRCSRFLRRCAHGLIPCALLIGGTVALSAAVDDLPVGPLSPDALAVAQDGRVVYVGCATAPQVLTVDLTRGAVVGGTPVAGPVSGLALSADGARLYATCPSPNSTVEVIDPIQGKVLRSLSVGHTATAPVLSYDETALWICHRFNHEVALVDLDSGAIVRRVAVEREPVAAALTPDGRYLLVANLLHNGRADVGQVAAAVSVVEVASGQVVETLRLPNGSGYLNDIAISPDGRYACVTHILSRFPLPTTQLERGWMNTNAGTLIDLESLTVLNTVLLDSVDRGAANPWGVGWSGDGSALVVAHAGTHEISVIEAPKLLAKLRALPEERPEGGAGDYRTVSQRRADVPNDLAFLVGLRQRVALAEGVRGPRALIVTGDTAVVAGYFSDTLTVMDVHHPGASIRSIALGHSPTMSPERLGEFYFHDADLCFQGWQSCASCHPGEARMDALNWDLLNDGIGNPKNNRSLLYSHRMGPAMSLGVRPTAEQAVRAGIRHILFTEQPEAVPAAIDAYLRSLRPVPSPHRVDGGLSEAAVRGQLLFEDAAVGCVSCHPGELFSDSQAHEVGTAGRFDRPDEKFFTPTLVEIWRTAPYLHDGSAATLREVVTTRNLEGRHGRTSTLSPEQIQDLLTYLLSL